MWTCNVAPIHTEELMHNYNIGLGIKTMEGREYADKSTFQNRWPTVFRHEFMACIFLCENGYDVKEYIKKTINYIANIDSTHCNNCGI